VFDDGDSRQSDALGIWDLANFQLDSGRLQKPFLAAGSKSESIERFLAEGAKVISLSDLARVEVLNVLL
jgi:hypothetical protein